MTSPTADRRHGLVGNTPIKAPVDCATTGNITLFGEQVIDGIQTASSRVLVWHQTDATQNGIYDSSSAAWTRSLDADGAYDLTTGTMVNVLNGTSQGKNLFQVSTPKPVTIGTSLLTWVKSLFSSSSVLSFLQAGIGAIARTVQDELRDRVSPMQFGGDGTGNVDDAAAITKALAVGRHIDMTGKTWLINSTIDITSDTHIDIRGASIIAATGATPLFRFAAGAKRLTIQHSGGTITGTASCFLFAEGLTDAPTVAGDFAGQIHLHGVMVSSATITTAVALSKAVKSVYLHGCNFFTPNGVSSTGKGVEVMVSDSIIYGATGAAGTAGFKLRSSGGTTHYNEGWSIVNSTIDGFEIAHDVTDVFVYTVTGGYTSSVAGGYAFQFQAPTTNLCEELTIGGGAVLGSGILFLASGGGRAYNAKIDALWNGVAGAAVAIQNNASNITISGKFKNGTSSPIGVVGTNNNASIRISGDFDSSYVSGVVLNGAAGADCVIGPLSGPVSGTIASAARAVLWREVPVHNSGIAAQRQVQSATNISGTFAVGATIETLSVVFAKGETGVIEVCLPYSGANAATQNVQVTAPAGMVMPGGTGWGAGNLYTGAAGGLLAVRIPYYCTADGTGNITFVNQAGNSLTIINQAHCGLVRDW